LGTSWYWVRDGLGTSWSGYELVFGTSWLGYELAWYDLVRVRVDRHPAWFTWHLFDGNSFVSLWWHGCQFDCG